MNGGITVKIIAEILKLSLMAFLITMIYSLVRDLTADIIREACRKTRYFPVKRQDMPIAGGSGR